VDNYLKAEIARREAEYRKEQLQSSASNIENLNNKIQRFSDKIQNTYRSLLDNEEYYSKVAKSLNAEISTLVADAKLYSRINDITTNLVQMTQEVSSNLALETDESEEMLAKEIKLENIGEELNYSINTFNTGNKNNDTIGDSIVDIYRKQATEQIKAQIYFSIEKIIYEVYKGTI
jgi:cysteinyl-tRNA synthetase